MKHEKQMLEFLRKISGKIGILFHADADGVCACALMFKYLKEKLHSEAEIFPAEYSESDFEKFLKNDFDYFLILDLSADEFRGTVEKYNSKKIANIDHHPTNDIKEIIIVNPRLDDPDKYISASEIVFYLLSMLNFEKNKWIMRLGAVGDNSVEGTDQEKHAVDIINSVKAIRKNKGLTPLISFLCQCNNLNDFIYNDKYKEIKQRFDKEIGKQVSLYELQMDSDINFFRLKTRLKITGILSTHLFELYPNQTIIVYKKSKGLWKISGRSKKYDLGKFFKIAAKDLGDFSGGHPVAAGAQVNDIKIFLERLRKLMK